MKIQTTNLTKLFILISEIQHVDGLMSIIFPSYINFINFNKKSWKYKIISPVLDFALGQCLTSHPPLPPQKKIPPKC